MITIGMDLGGTKLATAAFDDSGFVLEKHTISLGNCKGKEVGALIISQIDELIKIIKKNDHILAGIGISVPGIYRAAKGTVWAPNIPDWEDYPLHDEVSNALQTQGRDIPVYIDSDRACCILGETWMGSAGGCMNAVFLAVGTGIGAGILCDGRILRGHGDIAGATGWMTLHPDYDEKYASCGYFEYYASGAGLVKSTLELLEQNSAYRGSLKLPDSSAPATRMIFDALEQDDPIARKVINKAITCWGMAIANIVSLLNPEIIILGGGVFGPAGRFIDDIRREAVRWAQPISMEQVELTLTALGPDAGLIGAGRLAMEQNPAFHITKRNL